MQGVSRFTDTEGPDRAPAHRSQLVAGVTSLDPADSSVVSRASNAVTEKTTNPTISVRRMTL